MSLTSLYWNHLRDADPGAIEARLAEAPRIDPGELRPAPDAVRLLPRRAADALRALPLAVDGDRVRVAVAEDARPEEIEQLLFHLGRPVDLVRAPGPSLRSAIARAHGDSP